MLTWFPNTLSSIKWTELRFSKLVLWFSWSVVSTIQTYFQIAVLATIAPHLLALHARKTYKTTKFCTVHSSVNNSIYTRIPSYCKKRMSTEHNWRSKIEFGFRDRESEQVKLRNDARSNIVRKVKTVLSQIYPTLNWRLRSLSRQESNRLSPEVSWKLQNQKSKQSKKYYMFMLWSIQTHLQFAQHSTEAVLGSYSLVAFSETDKVLYKKSKPPTNICTDTI